jgi:hypothetical protein
MKKFELLFLCFFLSIIVAKTQDLDSLRKTYNNKVIYRFGNFFMEGANRLTIADLEPAMHINNDVFGLFQKSRKQKRLSIYLNIASFACLAGNILRTGNGQFNTAPTYLLLIGQMGFGLAAGQNKMLATKTLDRAIWLRNREILFPR